MKAFLKRIIVAVFGRKIVDYKTEQFLGKAIVIFWRSKIHIIGFTGENSLLVVWLPTRTLTYWKASIGFTVALEPDFENVSKSN